MIETAHLCSKQCVREVIRPTHRQETKKNNSKIEPVGYVAVRATPLAKDSSGSAAPDVLSPAGSDGSERVRG